MGLREVWSMVWREVGGAQCRFGNHIRWWCFGMFYIVLRSYSYRYSKVVSSILYSKLAERASELSRAQRNAARRGDPSHHHPAVPPRYPGAARNHKSRLTLRYGVLFRATAVRHALRSAPR